MSLLPRNEHILIDNPPDIKIMTWNILADQLALDFPAVNPDFLKWDYRRGLILEEIDRINSDILLLQELDHYVDCLLPHMKEKGFEGIFQQKGGWHRDGIAIFYKPDKFSVLDNYLVNFPGSQFAIGLKLQMQEHIFYVFTTHLKAKKDYDNIRVEQIRYLFDFIQGLERFPMIIGGDFNSNPGTNAHSSLVNNPFGLKSIYHESCEVLHTTVKFRKTLEVKVEDYIWSCGCDVLSYYNLPSREEIGPNGLPSQNYPSDHLSLAASIRFSSARS